VAARFAALHVASPYRAARHRAAPRVAAQPANTPGTFRPAPPYLRGEPKRPLPLFREVTWVTPSNPLPVGLYAPKTMLEFPRLEYIPIAVETLGRGKIPADGPAQPQLEVVTSLERYRSLVDGCGLALVASRPPDPAAHLTLLALNLEAEACFYRGLKASLLARPAPGRVQLMELTRRYFYKDAFQLAAVDQEGRALATAVVTLTPQKARSVRIGLFPS